MKRICAAIVITSALILPGARPVAACDQLCGIANTPWGEPVAVCLVFPIDNGWYACQEINIMSIHTCWVNIPCNGGFPVV